MRTTTISTIAMVLVFQHALGNAIINGDFQSGTLVPATSAYAESLTMSPPQTWAVTSFDTLNASWMDFFDHTAGDASGRFMVVNGSTSGGGPAWSQEISVNPDTRYLMKGWFASVNAAAPASLELRVLNSEGVIATHVFQLSVAAGVWNSEGFSFDSGSASTVTVQVWDKTNEFFGNDYAIDDLSVTVVPQLQISSPAPHLVELAWPATASDYNLETSHTLQAMSWSPVTTVPQVVGTRFSVIVPVTSPRQFFRLRFP